MAMSEPREVLGPEEGRAAEAVRGLSQPRPEATYRDRLKREFVAGTLGLPGRGLRAVDAPAPREPRPTWSTLVMPAAAGLVMVSALVLNQGSGWQVVGASGGGAAEVDGVSISLQETAALERAIAAGGRVILPSGGSLRIAAPGLMTVEITPSTEAMLSRPPARWLGRIASAELANGEIRVSTGSRFHGSRLMVRTPEAAVEVTGTTLAVIREPTGTCVCVMEGTVRVGAHGKEMMPVSAGRRRYLFRDGRPPEQAEMRPIERVKLGEMVREGRR